MNNRFPYDGYMDPVLVSDDHRNALGKQLTRRLGQLLGDGTVSFNKATEIAEFILAKIDQARTHEDLINFLIQLHTNWPHFEASLKIEKATLTDKKDKQKAKEIAEHIKQNQIDVALNTAKSN